MKILYEILVPTIFGDTGKSISTRHHQQWDKFVQKITGGLTILKPARGKWLNKGVEYPERIIPVRVMCEEKQIDAIIDFTLRHYRQKAVMYYVVSNHVQIKYAR